MRNSFPGHYIAFKILAALRDKVFGRLRKLGPAKLDGRRKGELVSIITADIELLETFYAHTIAPVMIALLTSVVYVAVLTGIHWIFGIIGAAFYALLGVVVPLIVKRMSANAGAEYRKEMGRSSAFCFGCAAWPARNHHVWRRQEARGGY